ncbi:MAG: hypothetical protein II750_08095 [Bacteroidaceae bacterium]|nr:hypothetical protein [Bacteroidaceae bacterium]
MIKNVKTTDSNDRIIVDHSTKEDIEIVLIDGSAPVAKYLIRYDLIKDMDNIHYKVYKSKIKFYDLKETSFSFELCSACNNT